MYTVDVLYTYGFGAHYHAGSMAMWGVQVGVDTEEGGGGTEAMSEPGM